VSLLSYKVIQLLIILIFVVFISDIRNKEGMKLLLNSKLTILIKLLYLVAVSLYGYSVVTLEQLLIYDFIAIGLTFLGMFLTVKAKRDLGDSHTWAGHFMEKPTLVAEGIYAYIRHPLYTGIYIFIFGGLATLIPHTAGFVTLSVIITSACAIAFLTIVARHETKLLIEKLGEEFLAYQKQVHAFLPLKRYKS